MKIILNKQYVLFLFLFYTLIFNELLVNTFSIFQYEDELIALMALPLFVLHVLSGRKLSDRTGSAPYIMGFVICTLLGSLYFRYQPFLSVAAPDLLLCLKFWLCIYTSKELFRKFDIKRFSRNLFFHVKLITWMFVILTVSDAVFGVFPAFDIRYGLETNMLFYQHPISLISSCSLLAIISLALKGYVKNGLFYVGLLAVVMVTTLRSKAIADVIVFLLLYFFVVVRKQKFSFQMVLALLPIVVLVGWSQIEYYFFELGDESARAQLLVKGFQIANDHFPLGAGFGTYGSFYSTVNYSSLYYRYGLNTVYGLSEQFGNFICDSFWPMIMGQSGYLGMAFYIGAIIKLVRKITELKYTNLCYYVSGLSAVLYLLIDSAASTAFVHPLSMPIALWIGILLANNLKESREKRPQDLSEAQKEDV